jgi:hypothetical protein
MSDDDITRLRTLAQAATPGPWQWDGNVCDYDESNESPWLVTDAYATGIYKHLRGGVILKGGIKCLNEADAAYIAAASPDAFLGLLDRLADAERERDALAADAARYRWLASRMVHVGHPAGAGWTLDEVLVSQDRDLDDVIDALAKEAKC